MNILKREVIDNNIIILNILSSIDNENVSEFKEMMFEISVDGSHKYIIDFSKVTYLNSLGIGVIVEFVKRTQVNNQNVIMANLNKEIKHLFKLLNLHTIFDVEKTREEAIEFLSQLN